MKEGKSFQISQNEVLNAYKAVKANKGAGGVDGVEFEGFDKDWKNRLYRLWNRMASGSYFPKPVRGVEIPKKNGKMRLLGIPTIEDRVAQMVLRNRLEPFVEPIFFDDSYGYRPHKSALNAVGAARERCYRMKWVVEFDIVDHQPSHAGDRENGLDSDRTAHQKAEIQSCDCNGRQNSVAQRMLVGGAEPADAFGACRSDIV